MDDEQIIELLTQIAELAGVGIDALTGGQGPEEAPVEGEGEAPPAEEPPAA